MTLPPTTHRQHPATTPHLVTSPPAGEAGQALVELALALAVLLIMATGMMNCALAFKNYVVLTNGVDIAARRLAISRGQTVDPCATVTNALFNAAPSLTQANMTFSTVINSGTSTWSYAGTTCSGPNTYSGAPGQLQSGGSIRFTATYPCMLARYGKGNLANCTMTAATSEAVQ